VEARVAAVAGNGHRQVLTEREAQIVQLVADGVVSSDIAERPVISPKTVRNHLSRVYDMLGVSTRADAVVAALHAGMIRLD
jgi:DNA-binding NarL/FixJ family response regulator